MAKIMFGASVDAELINDAKAAMELQLKQPVSQAAMIRTLLGLAAEGKITVSLADVLIYSPETYTYNNRKKSSA